VLNYLRANVLPKLQQSLEHGHDIPPDLSEESLQSLELLMLAQAQESAWQRAVLGKRAKTTSPIYVLRTSQIT
jgi:programmed cell death 6-interacting protein